MVHKNCFQVDSEYRNTHCTFIAKNWEKFKSLLLLVNLEAKVYLDSNFGIIYERLQKDMNTTAL